MRKLTVKVGAFRPCRQNTLRGFATVVILEARLRLIDLTVHESHGKRWAGLPARPQVSKDGAVRRDERGKTAYSTVIQFTDRPTADAFTERVIAALLEAYPRAFADLEEAVS